MFFKRSQLIVTLGIIAFLVMSFWGAHSMPMEENGKMSNCPFMVGSVSLCQMSFSEHMTQWQQLFTMTREKSLLLSSLVLLIFFLAALFSAIPRIHDKLLPQEFHNYFYKHKPEIKLFNYLLVAFSQGILNPHIYV